MELLNKVNSMLLEGNSIAQVEKILGYGKDTLRKKLNRHGYKFNKETRQYEILKIEVCEKNIVSPKNESTSVVTDSYRVDNNVPGKVFTNRQLEVIYKLINEYELKERIKITDIDKGELGNRNVRVYVDHFNEFSNWCKQRGVTQADALYEAINVLMKKY